MDIGPFTIPSPFPPDFTTSWITDLSLLHHFTTVTAKSLFRSGATPRDRETLWQIAVPALSFSPSHTFLLHEILATAAFHLAYLRPAERRHYHVLASQHQTVAIRGVRTAVERITGENCHAVFAASSLFFITALAAARPDGRWVTTVTVGDIVDIFLLVKGIGGVLDSAETDLRKGPFGKFFTPRVGSGEAKLSLTLGRVTGQLGVFLGRVRGLPEGDEVRQVVEREVELFRACVMKAAEVTADPEYRVIASFPIVMTEGFVGLLRKRNQVALGLLSYYCVVVNATEEGYWFTRGWGLGIMRDVVGEMGSPWDQDSAWALGWIEGHEEGGRGSDGEEGMY